MATKIVRRNGWVHLYTVKWLKIFYKKEGEYKIKATTNPVAETSMIQLTHTNVICYSFIVIFGLLHLTPIVVGYNETM